MKTFQDLKTGRKHWSEILREDRKMLKSGPPACAYCGSTESLSMDHIIPQRINVPAECDLHQIHNLVWCCRPADQRR